MIPVLGGEKGRRPGSAGEKVAVPCHSGCHSAFQNQGPCFPRSPQASTRKTADSSNSSICRDCVWAEHCGPSRVIIPTRFGCCGVDPLTDEEADQTSFPLNPFPTDILDCSRRPPRQCATARR